MEHSIGQQGFEALDERNLVREQLTLTEGKSFCDATSSGDENIVLVLPSAFSSFPGYGDH